MPPHISYPYTGRLILRLSQAVTDQLEARARNHQADLENLEQLAAAEIDLGNLPGLLPSGLVNFPVVQGFPLLRVMELENRARRSPFPPIHRLGGYFVLDPRRALTLIQSERLLADLKAFATTDQQVADHVYREPDLREPTGWAVDPSDDDYFPQQGYLKGGVLGPHANWGINADCSAVWGLYDGNGIGLVDFEVTWNVGHEDLPAAVHPLYNINQFNPAKFDYGDHGTAVLGIVLGQDNAKGVVGVAPKGTLKRLVSRIKSQTDEWDVVGALLAALDPGVMNLGDVLLVEVETVVGNPLLGCPIEIVDHWFDAVRLVVGNGMVVVEAAGNGYFDQYNNKIGRNLDELALDWTDAPPWRSLNRNSPSFLDSGAIMVSACGSAVIPPASHRRLPYACYGSRVDCYAWGENVFTAAGWNDVTGPSPGDYNSWYTDNFGGTSSASAIIAGAALLVQQMHKQTRGWCLTPAQVRLLLSDPTSGVQIINTTGETLRGVMPDLARVAAKISAIPDIFIRDSLQDVGAVPNSLVYQSPDIILRSAPSNNPSNEFGDGSLSATQLEPNDPVRPGLPNYIYVRMRNRTSVAAAGARAKVYWSEASSLVAPVHWHLIDQTNSINVPGGGSLAVASLPAWIPAAGELPVSGHGCLVAVLEHELDPAPPLIPPTDPETDAPTSWQTFLDYAGRNNNVAWRNFFILEPSAAGATQASFVLRGAGDHPRRFTIELSITLPPDSRVWWEVPKSLAVLLRGAPGFAVQKVERTPDGSRFLIGRRILRIDEIELDPCAAYQCALQVQVPRGAIPDGSRVTIRQFYKRTEVGRITWDLRREEPLVG
jgi:serine protease